MASGLYNRGKYNAWKKNVDMSSDSHWVILLNNSHSFNADHNVLGDIDANELATAGGYTAGGAEITTPTLTQDDTNDCAVWNGDDVQWTSATFTAYHAGIYNSSFSNNLFASIDFGGAKSVTAGTFKIQWANSPIAGIAKLA